MAFISFFYTLSAEEALVVTGFTESHTIATDRHLKVNINLADKRSSMNMLRIKHLFFFSKTLLQLGPNALLHNLWYRVGLFTGRYEKLLPLGIWGRAEKYAFIGGPWRKVDSVTLRSTVENNSCLIDAANAVVDGNFSGFSWCRLALSGNWQTNPQTGFEPPREHWSRISSLPGADAGDIKWTWEASRFEWIYILGRAWSLDRNPKYPETFWKLLSDWRRDNLPQQGVNWMSGQESALKIFALLWAANLWLEESQESQREELLETVAVLAETIEVVFGYALSQRNNHGIGESVALYLVGSVLKGHKKSEKWRKSGFQLAIDQIEDQFAKDGSYIQHSNNYSRVALRYASIFITTVAWSKQELPQSVRAKLLEAVKLLWIQQDQITGQVPNYGANDGANPVPLNSCDYPDFRPILHCVYWQLTGKFLYDNGPWNEELLWVYALANPSPPFEGERPTAYAASEGGYYVLRGLNSHAMIRCTSLNSRPGHADMLHLDFWAKGKNLLSDGGTFQYVDKKRWGSYLSSTAAHNTVEINGASQMTRGGQFLWLKWTRAKLLNFMNLNAIGLQGWDGQYLAGEHRGYYQALVQKGIIHRRQILQVGDQWLIIDDLIARKVVDYTARLSWHLDGVADWEQMKPKHVEMRAWARSRSANFEISVWGFSGISSWFSEEKNYPVTLRSRYYGRGESCTVLSIESSFRSSARWITIVGHGPAPILQGDQLDWYKLNISLQSGGPTVTN